MTAPRLTPSERAAVSGPLDVFGLPPDAATLIDIYGDREYDCGAWDEDEDGSYAQANDACCEARAALTDYVARALAEIRALTAERDEARRAFAEELHTLWRDAPIGDEICTLRKAIDAARGAT